MGSPTDVIIVTDHKPLCSIFDSNKVGSVHTERINLRHQDVRFVVQYQAGRLNQADYISRHAKPLELVPKQEQTEAEDLNNILYMLHATPIMECISLAAIAGETKSDQTLSKIQKLIQQGTQWIPKNETEHIRKFNSILQEITIMGNGILKGERIILLEKLQTLAMELIHRESHPGQTGIQWRLRFHFFFHYMAKKVKEFIHTCKDCNMFVDKKTMEPILHHQVPSKNWQTVAVDLYGPMPSSRHVIVVQDLASRYPIGKLVMSTKADKVIPVLEEVYDIWKS